MDRQSLSDNRAALATKGDATLIEGDLRALTPARVALARTGNSITTHDTLAFARDHAQARDAVHAHLSLPTLLNELRARGLEAVVVKSAAS